MTEPDYKAALEGEDVAALKRALECALATKGAAETANAMLLRMLGDRAGRQKAGTIAVSTWKTPLVERENGMKEYPQTMTTIVATVSGILSVSKLSGIAELLKIPNARLSITSESDEANINMREA